MEQEHKNFDKLVSNPDLLKGLYLNNFNLYLHSQIDW